jgi:hypothetical protein
MGGGNSLIASLKQSGTTRSTEQVKNMALDAMNLIMPGGATRSGFPLQIGEMIPIKLSDVAQTRSGSDNYYGIDIPEGVSIPDTLAWAVNFTNDNGFAVIAADTRVSNSTLAISSSGNIPPVFDSLDNEGLQMFLALTEPYLINEIVEEEHLLDSLFTTAITLNPNSNYCSVLSDTTIVLDTVANYQKYPMIPTEWGQGAPFNQYCVCPICAEYNEYYLCKAGCLPVAMAQIIAADEYPLPHDMASRINLSWGGIATPVPMDLTWDEMNQYSGIYNTWNRAGRPYEWLGPMSSPNAAQERNAAASILKVIGDEIGWVFACPEAIDQSENGTYNIWGRPHNGMGGTPIGDDIVVSEWFSDNGFQISEMQEYSSDLVSINIRNSRPVLVRGGSSDHHSGLWGGVHFWNIDGMIATTISYERTVLIGCFSGNGVLIDEYEHTETFDNTITWHHQNWGSDGRYNGYYTAEVYDAWNWAGDSNTMTRTDAPYYEAGAMWTISRLLSSDPFEGVNPADRFPLE